VLRENSLMLPAAFHPLAFSVLRAAASELLPLSAIEFQPQDLPAGLLSTAVEQLFPQARDAQAALAGLLLMAGHWELSHQVSQVIATAEGSYWHAIAHRIEPDFSNAAYWFQRAGKHPIFSALNKDAAALLSSSTAGWQLKKTWDPRLFLTWCEEAGRLPLGEKSNIARQIQRLEYERLFAWCALKTNDL
jgi:hypothetical protein